MTWYAKAIATSYLTAPGTGPHSREESGHAFLYSTTWWYFLDAGEVFAPAGAKVVAAFGDSITDDTGSTLNGDDRWPRRALAPLACSVWNASRGSELGDRRRSRGGTGLFRSEACAGRTHSG
jgi:hypothetical protein